MWSIAQQERQLWSFLQEQFQQDLNKKVCLGAVFPRDVPAHTVPYLSEPVFTPSKNIPKSPKAPRCTLMSDLHMAWSARSFNQTND